MGYKCVRRSRARRARFGPRRPGGILWCGGPNLGRSRIPEQARARGIFRRLAVSSPHRRELSQLGWSILAREQMGELHFDGSPRLSAHSFKQGVRVVLGQVGPDELQRCEMQSPRGESIEGFRKATRKPCGVNSQVGRLLGKP